MARSAAQKVTDNTARQAAAAAVETAAATLITNINTYLNAASGDNHHARRAVFDFVFWKLSTTQAGNFNRQQHTSIAPGYPHKNLSLVDFELATD